TVIPVQLGTFIHDETEVKCVLDKGYGLIKEILDKVNDKIEIDVAVIWNDFASALKEIGEGSEIKKFKDELLTCSEEITNDDRIKIGTMVSSMLAGRREEYSSQIHDILSKISENVRAHDVMDDKMILNSAFLINKNKLRKFDGGIELLDIGFDNKLNFKCIGPLPPYSFYTLEIKKFQFEEVDWARNKLFLNEAATRDEVKKAYQKQISLAHPDKNPGKQGLEKEFNDIVKAYKVLLEYCQGEACSFSEQDFKKNALLVRVKA
ncbi:MAG: GvpL/GvpF family gas vesicle protein, partial [bacterium]